MDRITEADYTEILKDVDYSSQIQTGLFSKIAMDPSKFTDIAALLTTKIKGMSVRIDKLALVGWRKAADNASDKKWASSLGLEANEDLYLPPNVNTETLAKKGFLGMKNTDDNHVEVYSAWLLLLASCAILQGNVRIKDLLSNKFIGSLADGLVSPEKSVGFSPAVQAVMIVLSQSIRKESTGQAQMVKFGRTIAISVVGLMLILLNASQETQQRFYTALEDSIKTFQEYLFKGQETNIERNAQLLLSYPQLINASGLEEEDIKEIKAAKYGCAEFAPSPIAKIRDAARIHEAVQTWGHGIATYKGSPEMCEKYCKRTFTEIKQAMTKAEVSTAGFGLF